VPSPRDGTEDTQWNLPLFLCFSRGGVTGHHEIPYICKIHTSANNIRFSKQLPCFLSSISLHFKDYSNGGYCRTITKMTWPEGVSWDKGSTRNYHKQWQQWLVTLKLMAFTYCHKSAFSCPCVSSVQPSVLLIAQCAGSFYRDSQGCR